MYENNGCARNMSKTFFHGGESFSRERSPPPYGPGHQMAMHAEITLCARLVYGYVFSKTSGSFSFGYLEIFSSWLG